MYFKHKPKMTNLNMTLIARNINYCPIPLINTNVKSLSKIIAS